MFACSKEEPVNNNEALYQKLEHIDRLILDSSQGIAINRYSFVSKGSISKSEIPTLVKFILNQFESKIYAIFCWPAQIMTKSLVASKVIEKKYAKQGWNIILRNNHYIAVKALMPDDINSWPPLGINPIDGGFVLLIGNYDINDILGNLSENCSSFLARIRYFVPDRSFLIKTANRSVMTLYQTTDDLGNTAIVLIGDKKLNLLELKKNLPIREVFEGKLAYKAFL